MFLQDLNLKWSHVTVLTEVWTIMFFIAWGWKCYRTQTSQVQIGVTYHLHEALSALWGDDSEVWLAAVDHLGAGRWGWRLGQDTFPQTVAVWNCEEARGGPSTGVSISCGVTEGQMDRSQLKKNFKKWNRWEQALDCVCADSKES